MRRTHTRTRAFYETSASAGGAELLDLHIMLMVPDYYIASATLIDHTNGDAETVFDSIDHWGSGKMNAIPTEANIAASLAYAIGQIPNIAATASSNGTTLKVNSSADFDLKFERTNYNIIEPTGHTTGTSQPFDGTVDTSNSTSTTLQTYSATDDTITVQIAPLSVNHQQPFQKTSVGPVSGVQTRPP